MELVRAVEIHRLDGDDNIYYSSVYNLNINKKPPEMRAFVVWVKNCDCRN